MFRTDDSDVSSRCDAKDFVGVVLRALALVDAIGEKVVRLRELEERSVSEVADELGVAKKTVSNKLSLALGILRSLAVTRNAS